jgi:hypothetical protein
VAVKPMGPFVQVSSGSLPTPFRALDPTGPLSLTPIASYVFLRSITQDLAVTERDYSFSISSCGAENARGVMNRNASISHRLPNVFRHTAKWATTMRLATCRPVTATASKRLCICLSGWRPTFLPNQVVRQEASDFPRRQRRSSRTPLGTLTPSRLCTPRHSRHRRRSRACPPSSTESSDSTLAS